MDEVEGDIAFRDRWQRFIDELLDEPGMQRPLLRAFTMGLQLKDLERVAQSFHENWERLEGVEFAPSQEPDLAHSPLGQAIEAARIELGPKPTPKVFEHLAELAPHVANLEATARRVREARDPAERDAAEVDLLRLACAFPKIRTDVGKRGVMSAVQAAHEEWVGAARRSYLTAVLPSLRQFVLDYAAERRADGHLGFQDLLVLAVELLRTNTEARRALHDRYRRVLIDEFQDTDPLQVELAALLACEPDDPPVRWTDAKVEPGRLFFVGDPKQSIYRFRRADIVLYERTRRAFGSEHVPLTTNFRSTPAILEWVNNIFEGLFDRDASDGVRQAEWVALQPHEQAERGHPVQLMGGPLEGASADEGPARKPNALAGMLHWPPPAQRTGWGRRRRREGPFRRHGHPAADADQFPAIERALADAGIPFRVESRSLVFATQDVRDLSNILSAIDDPTDDVAVVASLRSPAFACRDCDLLAHVQAGGSWSYLAEPPGASPECVKSGFASLRRLHARRWHLSTGALIEEVVASRHMLELAVAGTRPRESWRRLRFVAEQARGLEEAGVLTTLRQFVEWLRMQADAGARVNEGVAVEPDDDAIRIMTIHAAKGLEFEIVFLGAWAADRFKRETTSSGRSARTWRER